jgi:hypothetical protein
VHLYVFVAFSLTSRHHEGDEFIDAIINTSAGGSNGGGDDDPVE